MLIYVPFCYLWGRNTRMVKTHNITTHTISRTDSKGLVIFIILSNCVCDPKAVASRHVRVRVRVDAIAGAQLTFIEQQTNQCCLVH